ncbi:MAG: hypothetical protein R3F19_09985 [Verrucomicrobiales bacterium]
MRFIDTSKYACFVLLTGAAFTFSCGDTSDSSLEKVTSEKSQANAVLHVVPDQGTTERKTQLISVPDDATMTVSGFNDWFARQEGFNELEKQQAIWKAGIKFAEAGKLVEFLDGLPVGKFVDLGVSYLGNVLISGSDDSSEWLDFSMKMREMGMRADWADDFFNSATAGIAMSIKDPVVGINGYLSREMPPGIWRMGLNNLFENYRIILGKEAADRAMVEVVSQSDSELKRKLLSANGVVRSMARVDWRLAIDLAGDAEEPQVLGWLGKNLAEYNPENRAEIANQLFNVQNADLENISGRSFFSTWLKSDMDSALKWSGSQEPNLRDTLIEVAYPTIREFNPEAAQGWLSIVENPEIKARLLSVP